MTNTARIANYPTDEEYHSDRSRLSGSALDLFAKNPRQYAAWVRGEWSQTPTPAMAFGSLFHALMLEPDEVSKRFAIEPEDPKKPGKCIHRGSTAYREWRAEATANAQTIVTPEQMADVRPMVEALGSRPEIVDLLTCDGGENEVAFHFDIEGRPMRAKMDRIIPGRDIVVELKTCRARGVGPSEMNARSWEGMGYGRKCWLYLEAYRQVFNRNACMVHVMVEKDTAHPQVAWYWTDVDAPSAQWGEIETLRLLGELQRCEEAGDFRAPFEPGAPGFSPRPLPLPGYLENELAFAGGDPVELDFEDGRKVTM